MNKFDNCTVILRTPHPLQLPKLPDAAAIARGLLQEGYASADELACSRLSDLFAQGYCAKPICFDRLFTPDPGLRPALKQLKAAAYMDMKLLLKACDPDSRYLMGASDSADALLQLLNNGVVHTFRQHLQYGHAAIPFVDHIDPRLPAPAVKVLDGSFSFLISAPENVLRRLSASSHLALMDRNFILESVADAPRPLGDIQCLQTAAAVDGTTHINHDRSVFRLRYHPKTNTQYLMSGSTLEPADVPGFVPFWVDGDVRYTLPYILHISI